MIVLAASFSKSAFGSPRIFRMSLARPPRSLDLAKASASSGLEKQNTTKWLSSLRKAYVSAADRTPAAQNITSLFVRPRTFSAGSAT